MELADDIAYDSCLSYVLDNFLLSTDYNELGRECSLQLLQLELNFHPVVTLFFFMCIIQSDMK